MPGIRFPASDKFKSVNMHSRYAATKIVSTRKNSHGFGQPVCTSSMAGVVFEEPTRK